MKLQSDLANDVIQALDNNLVLIDVSAVVDSTQIVRVECSKWIKLFSTIIVNNLIYPVLTYNEDGTFTISLPVGFAVLNNLSQITIQRPIFLNGTFLNTKLEWANMSLQEKEKLPFIWLVSPTTTTGGDTDATIDSAEWNLWLVHWSDWKKLNADRQDEAIRPLAFLKDEFIATIKRMTEVFPSYENFTSKDYPKWGVENEKGIEKVMLDSTLSAIELNINVNFYRSYCEKC